MDDPNKKESVADVLARMQGELSFDVQDFVEPGDVMNQPAEKPQPKSEVEDRAMRLVASADSALSHADDQDGDVSNYMENLLGRYGNESAEPTAPTKAKEEKAPAAKAETKPAGASAEPKAKATTDKAAAETQEVEEKECPRLLNQHEYLPQKKAPEEKASIAAMRELAVHSARKAIADSVQKQRGMDASFRLSLGMGCIALALGAFYLSEGFFTVMGMLGIASVVGATAFLLNWQSTVRQKN